MVAARILKTKQRGVSRADEITFTAFLAENDSAICRRFDESARAERGNSRLKDKFGCRHLRGCAALMPRRTCTSCWACWRSLLTSCSSRSPDGDF